MRFEWLESATDNPLLEGIKMHTVTVSHKYQIVIPKHIRMSMKLQPGQKMKVIEYDGRIELIPDKDIGDLKGFLAGINTNFTREEDRL